MTSLAEYFLSLSRFIAQSRTIIRFEPDNPFRRLTESVGRVEARIHFADGSYLDVGEMIRIERGAPVNFHYRYHLQRPAGPSWTYDDAPHHPEVATFPFHRHRYHGTHRTVDPHARVTLMDALEEALRVVGDMPS